MTDTEKLWPYRRPLAFLAMPVIWLLFVLVFILGEKIGAWKNEIASTVVIVIAVISVLPVLLMLLDFFALKKAVIDTKWIKIDFSNYPGGEMTDVKAIPFELPDNIGIPVTSVASSSPVVILDMLKEAVEYDIVLVNIKSGNAWWVTRLLALCAGAVRAGMPKAVVLLGKKDNILDSFLGWGRPGDLLKAILNDNQEYRTRYDKAIAIARDLKTYQDVIRIVPGSIPPVDILGYLGIDTTAIGEGITEQIIMNLMGPVYFDNIFHVSLEDPPDRLTLSRVQQLFGHCLYQETIELDGGDQLQRLLDATAPYIPLVRKGQYQGMLKREDGERLVLKEWFLSAQKNNN